MKARNGTEPLPRAAWEGHMTRRGRLVAALLALAWLSLVVGACRPPWRATRGGLGHGPWQRSQPTPAERDPAVRRSLQGGRARLQLMVTSNQKGLRKGWKIRLSRGNLRPAPVADSIQFCRAGNRPRAGRRCTEGRQAWPADQPSFSPLQCGAPRDGQAGLASAGDVAASGPISSQ